MGVNIGEPVRSALLAQKGPQDPVLTPGAERYRKAVVDELKKTISHEEVLKIRAGLTPADNLSIRRLAAFHLGEEVRATLADPSASAEDRENAQITLGLLQRGKMPAGPMQLMTIETGDISGPPSPPPGQGGW